MEDQTFKNYLHDLGTLVKENARGAKEQKDSSRGSLSQDYNSGYLMAWYEVVSLMQQQAEAFDIPFEALDLHDIDPDKDLLGNRNKPLTTASESTGIPPFSVKSRVEYTDEFGEWWDTLTEAAQNSIRPIVKLLEERGAMLPFRFSSLISNSRHRQIRELRVQSKGNPIRIFYALDPQRYVILLIGGHNKTGTAQFDDQYIPIANRLYDDYLEELRRADMSGYKPFSELTKYSSPEQNAMVEAETNRLREELILR